jgi:ribosomal-protein-alanine N-acetyltransferase
MRQCLMRVRIIRQAGWMFPAEFHTARLDLWPIGPGDARAIFDGYAQDPEVSRYLTWRPHAAIEQTERYIQSCLEATGSRTYVLVHRSATEVIGAFDLRDAGPARLGYGYVLARPFWGQGLMTEALAHLALWALRQPTIWRIGDVVDVDNGASARVMEKAGFAREGLLRRWSIHPNTGSVPRDCFSYAKVR